MAPWLWHLGKVSISLASISHCVIVKKVNLPTISHHVVKRVPGDPAAVAQPRADGSRRGRPTVQQATAIDGEIRAAARRLFLKDGYANTAMETVAASARVSKATLYNRYRTKALLFEAVAAERIDAWTTTEFEGFAGSLRDNLIARAVAMMAAMRNPELRAFDHLIQSESPRFPEIFRTFYERSHLHAVADIAAVLRKAGRDDGSACIDPESVAENLVLSIVAWFRGQLILGEIDDVAARQRAERVVALIMAARNAW